MLAGRTAIFCLTDEGQKALLDLPVERGLIEAFVVAQDGIGAWIITEASDEVRLLKWGHFLTARFTLPPERPPGPRKRIGFR
jgi:hypothetical protein